MSLNGEAWLNREGVKTVACCKRAAQRVQINIFFAWKVEILDEIKFCCYSEKDENNETQKNEQRDGCEEIAEVDAIRVNANLHRHCA
uniref:Uncharacterized protein n=1 Tax=Romanomermis culicivorax TaxID=13658 RepID=A0A915JSV1_ROMCU